MRSSLIPTLLLLALVFCNDGGGPTPTYINALVGGKYWSGPASEGVVVYPAGIPNGPGLIYTIAAHTKDLALVCRHAQRYVPCARNQSRVASLGRRTNC